ncbi:autotransporter assembly complex protein TamB [Motilimonas pumila]|uniref:Translocation/assembly module TamB n=1 Tax=Motilimonas pumila TaxID=2303987 RepID=A0A418YG40_9GAMM|nr:translocation/assembly module TamB domain-containing protein [Motilimonas pumila]RJG48466.1 translocation/assembly module TamB [Motilimonas pumila]
MMWLRRIFLAGIFFITVIIGLLLSHQGNAWLLKLTTRWVPQLQIELSQGTLLFGAEISHLSWQDEMIELDIANIRYRMDWSCLPQTLCLTELAAAQANIALLALSTDSDTPSNDAEASLGSISLPIALEVGNIDLKQVSYRQPGLVVDLEHFFTQLKVNNQQGVWANPSIHGLTVAMLPDQPAQETEPAHSQHNSSSAAGKGNLTAQDKSLLSLPEIHLPIAIELAPASLSQFVFTQDATRIDVTSVLLRAKAQDANIKITELDLVMPQANAAMSANVEMQDTWPMQLDASAEVKDFAPVTGQKLTLNLQGDLDKLHADVHLNQLIEAQLSGHVAPLNLDFPHQLKLTWPTLQWPLTGKGDYRLAAGEMSSKGSLKQFAASAFSKANIDGVPEFAFAADVTGNLSKIKVKRLQLDTLQGKALLSGDLSLGDSIAWQGQLGLDNIRSDELAPDFPADVSGNITHEFKLAGDKWAVNVPDLKLDGSLMNEPLHISGQFSTNQDLAFDIPGVDIVNGLNQIHAKGKVSQQANLHVRIDVPDITKSYPDGRGSIKGEIKVSGALTAPELDINLSALALGFAELSIAQANVQGKVVAAEKPSGNISLVAEDIMQPGFNLTKVALSLDGDANAHQAALAIEGTPVAANVVVSGKLQKNTWQGSLNQAWFSSIEGRWQLAAPAAITADIDKAALDLAQQCWHSDNSRFCIEPSQVGSSGQASLNLERYLLNRVQPFMPAQAVLNGSISSQLALKWSPDTKPTAKLTLAAEDAGFTFIEDKGTEHAVPIKQLSLDGQLDQSKAKIDFKLDAAALGQADVALSVAPYSEQQNVQGTLRYQGLDLAALHYLVPVLERLKGALSLDMMVSGPLQKPAIQGQLVLTDAELGGGSMPMMLTGLQTKLTLDGYQGALSGEFYSGKGKAELDGEFDWQKELDAWLTLKGDKLEVDYLSQVRLNVSPDIKLAVADKAVSLTGQVEVPSGLIHVTSLPAGAVSMSDDIVVVDDEVAPKQTSNMPIIMDLAIRILDRVEIDAFGLRTHLQGLLAVKKKVDGPVLTNGEIHLVDGTYRAFGQSLVINRGQIIFSGPPDKPFLSVDAIRDPDLIEDDVTAGIKLEGPVSEPEVTIYSQPAMDQQNALSYLLRGRGMDSDSGDNSMVTTMLISMGVGRTAGTINQIGEAFGVKDLSVDSSGSGDSSKLTISGYILPGVQVRYGIGLFDSVTDVAIRYEVLPKLYLEAVSGLNNAFDIYYEFDWE